MAVREALLIGNVRYRDVGLSRLRTPAGDVKGLEAVLADPKVGGFAVQSLIDSHEPVLRRRIAEFFRNRDPDDILLCYFSGHGVIDEKRRLYFAVEDTEVANLAGTAYPAALLRQHMDDCMARRQILILDCCHSGAFGGGFGDPKSAVSVDAGSMFSPPSDEDGGGGRVILTATSATQLAWEGQATPAQQSLFTHHLTEGLRTGAADADGDGEVTVDEIYAYVRRKVRTIQNPLKWTFNQDGSLMLARNPTPFATPERLPEELRRDVASEHIHRRLAAVSALAEIAVRPRPGEALAARDLLRNLTRDDSRRVGEAASAAMKEITGEVPASPAIGVPDAPRSSASAGAPAVAAPQPPERPTGAFWPRLLVVSALLLAAGAFAWGMTRRHSESRSGPPIAVVRPEKKELPTPVSPAPAQVINPVEIAPLPVIPAVQPPPKKPSASQQKKVAVKPRPCGPGSVRFNGRCVPKATMQPVTSPPVASSRPPSDESEPQEELSLDQISGVCNKLGQAGQDQIACETRPGPGNGNVTLAIAFQSHATLERISVVVTRSLLHPFCKAADRAGLVGHILLDDIEHAPKEIDCR